jgi:hypothetical protein
VVDVIKNRNGDSKASAIEYAKSMGVIIGARYKLRDMEVTTFVDENDGLGTAGALCHGFVHYRYALSHVRFAGVLWFARNAVLLNNLNDN